MQKYIYISIGGALGAALRLAAENIHILNYSGSFPLNTLAVNIAGSFMLALFLTASYKLAGIGANLQAGVSVGFLGAFTTFSAFCKETALLMAGQQYYLALLYMAVSAVLGLAAICCGIALANMLIKKQIKRPLAASAEESEA